MMNYEIRKDYINIYDSYQVSKKHFDSCFDEIEGIIEKDGLDCEVLKNRSRCNLKLEWATHNFLYNLNIQRSRTKDVCFEYPQAWYYKVGYAICGVISWIFIK